MAAYKAAAEAALIKVQVIEKFVTRRLRLSFGYEATSEIMRLLSERDVKILQHDFGTTTDMVLSVNLQQREKILSRLELLKALGKAIDWQFES